MRALNVLLIIVLSFSCCGQCYNILGIFPMPSMSHMKVFGTLMKELAKIGHNVTVVSAFPQVNMFPNYRDVDLSGYLPKFVEVIDISPEYSDNSINRFLGPTKVSQMADIICEVLNSPPYQNFLNENGSYDAILIENFNTDCFLSIVHKFKAPVIGFSSSGILPWMQQRYGNPNNPAYIPDIFLDFSDKMSFLQRVENTIAICLHNIFYQNYRNVKDKEVVTKYIGNYASDLESIVKKSSLLLINTHYTLNLPRPLAPNIIEIGGIHIQESKNLSQDLSRWINNSPHGIIYFSMGSMTKGHTLPKKIFNSFINAFQLLTQRVIWKWENDAMDGKTDNILFKKWLPQLDVLCHPNVKLFISHGGLLGMMEAVYCGVPVLVMPQYGDQNVNARSLEARGAGVVLRMSDVTEKTAYSAMVKAMQLRNNMKDLSFQFKDRPLSPLKSAVYWTEYIARHNGALFMKTAAVNMPFYQYYLLDVLMFLVSILFLTIYSLLTLVNFVSRLRGKQNVSKQKRE